MDQVSLRANQRTEFGSRVGRRLRRAGSVPAVVYGHGLEPLSVAVDRRELHAALHTDAGSNALINLEVAGNSKPFLTVAREVQRHPVRGDISHLDFISITLDEEIHAEVAIEYTGLPIGVKRDAGIVETIRTSVNIQALPLDIPGHITLDISELEVGSSLRVADLPAIKGVTYLDEPETNLVAVIIPRVIVEEPTAAALEAAALAEAAAAAGTAETEEAD